MGTGVRDMQAVLSDLLEAIRIPTPQPPGDVSTMAEWVAHKVRTAGGDVQFQEVKPTEATSAGDNRSGIFGVNVICTLDFGAGPVLAFNGHMDVNTPSGQEWSFDPFSPFIKDGKVWGRGACDAKGSLVAMVHALRALANASRGLRGRLILTAVMGEEAGGIGSRHLVEQGFSAEAAVVGEPTDLEVLCAHKGTLMRRLTFHGRAAHSGRPELGRNAISHAAAFILEYDRLCARLAQRPHPLVGPPSAAVTVCNGGSRPNTIPDRVQLVVDRRLVPGETHENARDELSEILTELRRRIADLHVDEPEVLTATVPSETPVDERIVQIALWAQKQVLGRPSRPGGFSAGSDMSKLRSVGIPTVILGPGSLAQAHAVDEFVAADQVIQAVSIYRQIATRFLSHH